jgi:plastocyanin
MGYGYRGGPSYYSYSTPYYYGSNMAFGAPLGNAEAGNIPTTNLPGGTSSSYYTPGGATASGATRMPGETTRIRFTDSQLDPPVVNLTVGMTVRWMNDSLRPQTVTSVNNDFDSGEILPGKEFVATFNRPGTFEYTSKNQKDFKGRIVVNPQR